MDLNVLAFRTAQTAFEELPPSIERKGKRRGEVDSLAENHAQRC
jgi:hypothetical protein